jgi:hypothetical protein
MPRYARGDDCSIKFGISRELRALFVEACAANDLTQARVLRKFVRSVVRKYQQGLLVTTEGSEDGPHGNCGPRSLKEKT